MSGSMTADLENSTSMILIVDAGSVERGNFTDAILIMDENSITDVILIVAADLTTGAVLTGGVGPAKAGSSMIGAGDMSAAKAVGAVTDEDESKVG